MRCRTTIALASLSLALGLVHSSAAAQTERRRISGDRVEISGSGRGLEAYADLRVLVPRGQRLEIYHGVGDARITSVDADLAVDVASADVTSERTRGRLSLDTGSG